MEDANPIILLHQNSFLTLKLKWETKMTVTHAQLYSCLSDNSSASNSRELATKDFVAKEISNAKSDIIKWMFIFWIGQVAVTLAIIYFRK